jgi:hypothetical protein
MTTFNDVYDVVKARPCASARALRCLSALKKATVPCNELPSLKVLMRKLDPSYRDLSSGEIVLFVLRASSCNSVASWVSLIAPKAWPTKCDTRVRYNDLHADCFLALDRWVRDWASRQAMD